MRRHEISETILVPIFELLGIVGIFYLAYNLRQITDGIPGIQLPIPYIGKEQFTPFVIFGALFWGIIFASGGLYTHNPERPFFDTVRSIIFHSGLWFLIYIGFVYLTTGFIFTKEIPRLIIGYVYILATFYSIGVRAIAYVISTVLYRHGILDKSKILVIGTEKDAKNILKENILSEYIYLSPDDHEGIISSIRSKEIRRVLSISSLEDKTRNDIINLCAIYAIPYSYPKILPEVYGISQKETFIGGLLVIESSALKIGAWGRILKRTLDILSSLLLLIILSPVFLLISILIYCEDPDGPVIFRNRRIGYGGKEFFLYKFRYMYWKYSVKDAYGIPKSEDAALHFEEDLKKQNDTRKGPLYKIKNDPRKTRVGAIIERLSLDELPQLWNVLIGNMSLVGPRPHQPREVALYDEHHHQVLTVKPGITGMAQVFGREKNSFEDEVRYDVYYIEHYSLLLDSIIIAKTFFVIIARALK